MIRTSMGVLLAPLIFGLCGCGEPAAVTINVTEIALGTTVAITVVAPDSAIAYSAIRQAARELHRIGYDFWEGEPNGALGRLNSERKTDHLELSALIDRALELGLATDGAFDIRIGQIIEAYGFISKSNYNSIAGAALDDLVDAAHLLQFTGNDSVRYLTGSAATLTLGGIAKGYAVDRVVEILIEGGCKAGVVNAGADLRSWGGTEEKPWYISIEDPVTGGILQELVILAGALATSGDYRTRFYSDTSLIHHIVDPESGHSADTRHSSSVYAVDCTTADALATAFFVLDEALVRELVTQMDRIGVFLLRSDYSNWHNLYMDTLILTSRLYVISA